MTYKKRFLSSLSLFLLLLVAGCTEQPEVESTPPPQEAKENQPQPQPQEAEPEEQKTWLYQLQRANPAMIKESDYEYIVIDPTANGKDSTRYTHEEISSITEAGKTVLAYLSIGEASAFKTYWEEEWGSEEAGVLEVSSDAPEWLGRYPNPAWPESVKVRYWEEAWWEILELELQKIKNAGFSGVYLDIVDGYLYWGDEETYEQESRLSGDPESKEEAADRMMDLVKRIADYVQEDGENLLVFPQNAEGILAYDEGSYLDAIDGIGSEDLWFNEDERSDTEMLEYRLSYLEQVTESGKPVLSVDYVLTESPDAEDTARVNEYYEQCEEQGFYCLAAEMDRELDEFIPLK